FAGTLDEVAVYRRTLSATEVLSHFQAAPATRPDVSDGRAGPAQFAFPLTLNADWLMAALRSWARN
ncbi:MAG TPA: hypothetical protein VL403_08895, partial [Candidatus Kryptonia bacterium]|nr:hypothetical protein [Candidatus Kryptonia bacterium]